jgi:hypothetical protein
VKDLKQRSDQHIDTAPAIDLGDTEISSIVSAGGGKYVGVLKEIPNKMESVVLFNSPRTRTTLGIRISSLTVDAVRKHLAESDAALQRQTQNDKGDRSGHRSRIQIPRLILLPYPFGGIVGSRNAQTD